MAVITNADGNNDSQNNEKEEMKNDVDINVQIIFSPISYSKFCTEHGKKIVKGNKAGKDTDLYLQAVQTWPEETYAYNDGVDEVIFIDCGSDKYKNYLKNGENEVALVKYTSYAIMTLKDMLYRMSVEENKRGNVHCMLLSLQPCQKCMCALSALLGKILSDGSIYDSFVSKVLSQKEYRYTFDWISNYGWTIDVKYNAAFNPYQARVEANKSPQQTLRDMDKLLGGAEVHFSTMVDPLNVLMANPVLDLVALAPVWGDKALGDHIHKPNRELWKSPDKKWVKRRNNNDYKKWKYDDNGNFVSDYDEVEIPISQRERWIENENTDKEVWKIRYEGQVYTYEEMWHIWKDMAHPSDEVLEQRVQEADANLKAAQARQKKTREALDNAYNKSSDELTNQFINEEINNLRNIPEYANLSDFQAREILGEKGIIPRTGVGGYDRLYYVDGKYVTLDEFKKIQGEADDNVKAAEEQLKEAEKARDMKDNADVLFWLNAAQVLAMVPCALVAPLAIIDIGLSVSVFIFEGKNRELQGQSFADAKSIGLLTLTAIFDLMAFVPCFFKAVPRVKPTSGAGMSAPAKSQVISNVKKPVSSPTKNPVSSPKEPTVKEPTVKEPTVKEPTVKEPTVKEPTVKEPTVKEPVNEEHPHLDMTDDEIKDFEKRIIVDDDLPNTPKPNEKIPTTPNEERTLDLHSLENSEEFNKEWAQKTQEIINTPVDRTGVKARQPQKTEPPTNPSKADAADVPANPSKTDTADAPTNPSKTDTADAPANPSKTDAADTPANPSKTEAADAPTNSSNTEAADASDAGNMTGLEELEEQGEHLGIKMDQGDTDVASNLGNADESISWYKRIYNWHANNEIVFKPEAKDWTPKLENIPGEGLTRGEKSLWKNILPAAVAYYNAYLLIKDNPASNNYKKYMEQLRKLAPSGKLSYEEAQLVIDDTEARLAEMDKLDDYDEKEFDELLNQNLAAKKTKEQYENQWGEDELPETMDWQDPGYIAAQSEANIQSMQKNGVTDESLISDEADLYHAADKAAKAQAKADAMGTYLSSEQELNEKIERDGFDFTDDDFTKLVEKNAAAKQAIIDYDLEKASEDLALTESQLDSMSQYSSRYDDVAARNDQAWNTVMGNYDFSEYEDSPGMAQAVADAQAQRAQADLNIEKFLYDRKKKGAK